MKKIAILLALLGAAAVLVAGASSALGGHSRAKAARVVTNGSVKGSYAFSFSTHDPRTGQDGAAVGSMVFDGLGHVSGVYSQNERFPSDCACGQLVVTEAPYTGTYTVHGDGSASLDICITLPGPETVRTLMEGAFSNSLRNLRLIQTQFADPCNGALAQIPNITSGTADKL
jgi:hypothetical protein